MAKRTACYGGVWFSRLDTENAQISFYSPLCKRKSCPTCAKIRKLQIAWRIRHAIKTLNEHTWFFCTVTMSEHWHGYGNDKKVRRVLSHGWSMLRKRMARRWKDIYWVKTIELHESGTPHTHFIIGIPSKYKRMITTTWLKKNAKSCGLGYIALVGTKAEKDLPMSGDEQYNKTYYIAKYTAKSDTIGIRAIAWSQNFPPLPPLEGIVDDWFYEGQKPDFQRWEQIVDVDYKTGRNEQWESDLLDDD